MISSCLTHLGDGTLVLELEPCHYERALCVMAPLLLLRIIAPDIWQTNTGLPGRESARIAECDVSHGNEWSDSTACLIDKCMFDMVAFVNWLMFGPTIEQNANFAVAPCRE